MIALAPTLAAGSAPSTASPTGTGFSAVQPASDAPQPDSGPPTPLRVVLVPPSTALVNAWKNQHVPVGLLLLAELARREDRVVPELWSGPLAFADETAADAVADALLRPVAGVPVAVVGFSAWCHTLPAQLSLAAAIKRRDPAVRVVFGGPQATAIGAELLATFDCVDVVLAGEAEESFIAWLRCVRDGADTDAVPGLMRRDPSGAVVQNPPPPPRFDLDTLPIPAHDLAPDALVATVESGRGCPWACKFCSTSAFFARRHRARAHENIVEELWALHRRGVRHVTFTDDIFTVDRKAVRAFCALMLERGPPLRWGCSTRIDCVDADLLRLMAAARCDGVLYGVETGSPALQKRMGKRLDVAKVLPTVALTAQAGIVPYCTFIFGFPDETAEDLADTLALVRRLLAAGVRVTAQTLAILPDTPYHRELAGDLQLDGFTSLSRAGLSASERAWVSAHPALFSSFFHLPCPAAPRATLVAAALLTNLLRQLPRTAAAADFGERVDPFAGLETALPDDEDLRWADDFDARGLDLVAAAVQRAAQNLPATEAAALRATFALERAALSVRTAWMNGHDTPRVGVGPGPGVFLHAPEGAEPLLARVVDDTRLEAEAVPAALAEAVRALGAGLPLEAAEAVFAAHLGPLWGPARLAALVGAGWLRAA